MSLVFKYKLFPIFMGMTSVLLAICVVIQNIGIAEFLNQVLYHKVSAIYPLLFTILIVLILRVTFNMLNQRLGDILAYKVKHDLRQKIVTSKSKASIGVQTNILTEVIDGITPFFNNYLPQVFKSMFIPFVIIIVMCFIHLNTAIIMAVTAPFIPLFYIIFGLKTRDESKEQMTYLNQFSQRFLNIAKGLITLRLFRRTTETENRIYKESTRFRDLTMKILKSAFLSGLMLEFISMLGIGLIALEATLSLVVFHHINFKIAVIAIILAPEFYNAIKDLGQAFHTGKQSEGASDIIFDFLNNVEESNINTPIINQNQQNQIYFDKVSYQYPNTTLYALKDITFSINQGEKIAIVGPSGAGKSTLANLIQQMITPTKGRIIFNSEVTDIGMLNQRPYIFSASVKDNITMFNEVSDEKILQTLETVGLKEKILSLNKGIHTVIGEGGEMLSGGQMRRIELCRVLLLRPSILIFDEPTTGLDIETERVVQQTLEHNFKHATTITIAHRNSTIRRETRRLYVKEGHLIKDDNRISTQLNKVVNKDETTY
ncbi:ABC transporter, ATP-binding protein, MsbA family [Staphylococcus hominis subsp. hominis C80]|nr:ABC transporter, ATP-binding protein, MsbA family [Staphylococcus hominis subsp. hominis C80]